LAWTPPTTSGTSPRDRRRVSAVKGTLYAEIDSVVANHPGKIVAWYWGHEHLGVIYDRSETWGIHGRCIGHSGFPYFRNPALNSYDRVAPEDAAADERLARLPAGSAPAALIVDGPNVDTCIVPDV
jgi:hypothetical protein